MPKKLYWDHFTSVDPKCLSSQDFNRWLSAWLNNKKISVIIGDCGNTAMRQIHKRMKSILMIATPAFGNHVHVGYYNSMMGLKNVCDKEGITMATYTPGSYSIISKARNACVAAFMSNPKATHLMFIDADIEFNPRDVIKLLKHDKPLIAGAYTMKQIEWAKAIGVAKTMEEKRAGKIDVHEVMQRSAYYHTGTVFHHEKNIVPELREDGLMHANGAATGFMMIKRSLIEALMKKHPEKQYYEPRLTGPIKDYFYALFDHYIHPEKKFYMGEDYAFCNAVLAMGENIWIDPDIKLIHHGQMGFHGHLIKQLQPIEENHG